MRNNTQEGDYQKKRTVRRTFLVSVVFALAGMMLFIGYAVVRADVSINAGNLLITEVAFKVTASKDWIELYVVDGDSVDWSGYRIYKGVTLRFTIPYTWETNGLTTGDYIVLQNVSPCSDDVQKNDNNASYWDGCLNGDFFGTDDIVQIKEASGSTKRVDAVVWSDNDDSFTGSVAEANGASSDDGMWDTYTFCETSCALGTGDAGAWTDSDDIAASESLARYLDPGTPVYADSNSKTDWYEEISPSQGSANSQTVITLASLTATPHAGYVLVEWETASEIDNYGFNIWRSEAAEGDYVKLNAEIIPAQGGPTTGANYNFRDDAVTNGVTYWYKLEDVDTHGACTFHGPVPATSHRLHWIYLPLLLKEGNP